ncbi:MAG: nuclear transport factor 2 family protein, partial [Chloroflexota bacterium]
MIDYVTVAAWLENYIIAWKSYDPEAIGALFSEDARYYYSPFDEPLVGREAIVASWLEDPDEPNTYDAHYEPLTVEGNIAVINGRSRYFAPGSEIISTEFDNIFVIRFDDHGHCVDFREWYMKKQ